MATKTSYSSAKFMLEIEGQPVGFLSSVDGGELFAAVVHEPIDTSGVVRKGVGAIGFSPIRISFGAGMGKSLYQWMADVLNRKGSGKSGAIVFCDYNYAERSRLQFDNATIVKLAFPMLDTGSKDAAHFTLTLQPEATRISSASIGKSVPVFGYKKRIALSSNFRLKITGLETECAKVNRIDAIIVEQPMLQSGERDVLQIPNVTFTLAESHAKGFYDWIGDFVLKGNNAPNNELAGTLELLDPSLKTTLFTLTLSNLGIFRIQNERSVNGAETIARVSVHLYCEEMAFNSADESTGSILASPTSKTSPMISTASAVSAPLAEILLGVISGRVPAEEALPASLRIEDLPQITNSNRTPKSELIARRLLATVQPGVFGTSASKRDEGASLGERWATEKATLNELDQVIALESSEWTAMNLGSEHSLIAQLREDGVIPDAGDGPIDLERDNFVEGIVAGASRLLRSVAPHLNRPK